MFELKKIGIVKRASAWLLDAILLSVLITGFMYLISLVCGYSAKEKVAAEYYAEWEEFGEKYLKSVAEYYGFSCAEGENGYVFEKDGLSATADDVLKALKESEGNDAETAAAYQAYIALPPAAKVNAQYRYVYSLLFMIVSLGVFLAYLVLEFIIPLILKNGQTVGKKVFGIGLVRPDCVKITNIALFARTILGKFAIETMFPVLLVFLFFFGGLGIFALILFAATVILNLGLFAFTKNRTPIHDILAGTVAVDIKLQQVFATEEELNAKKAALHRESVENSREGQANKNGAQ